MSSVEEERERLEKELGEIAFTPQPGALCFLDQHRVCSTDCVAWNTAYQGKTASGPEACVLLTTVVQLNIGVLSVGQLLSKAQQAAKTPRTNLDPPTGAAR